MVETITSPVMPVAEVVSVSELLLLKEEAPPLAVRLGDRGLQGVAGCADAGRCRQGERARGQAGMHGGALRADAARRRVVLSGSHWSCSEWRRPT